MDRAVAEVTKALLELAAPQPGERVLDIGCGSGTTTLELAARVGPDGHVLGADIAEQIRRPGGRVALAVFRAAGDDLWPNGPLAAMRHLLPPLPAPGPEEPGPFSWADPGRVHRILEGAGFQEVSLTALDPLIQLGERAAEAAQFMMLFGPLTRILPALTAPQRDTVRSALERFSAWPFAVYRAFIGARYCPRSSAEQGI